MDVVNDRILLIVNGFRNFAFDIGLEGVGGVYTFPRTREMAWI